MKAVSSTTHERQSI